MPVNEHAAPAVPDVLQYFMFAPLPLVGQGIAVLVEVMLAGQMFVSASQLTWQPHELLHVTSLHAESGLPVQVAVHLSAPQVIVPHAAEPPLQLSVHFDVASPLHTCDAHAFAPLHVRVQSPVPLHVRLPQTC